MLLILSLFACDLTKVGAYDCDAYCGEVLGKTEECATVAAEQECEDQGVESACGELTDEQLSSYAAQGREDWEGAARDDMLASCKEDIAAAGKTDAQCQAETATLNNITCDDLLSLLGTIQASAQ